MMWLGSVLRSYKIFYIIILYVTFYVLYRSWTLPREVLKRALERFSGGQGEEIDDGLIHAWHPEKPRDAEPYKFDNKTKYILFYTPVFGNDTWSFRLKGNELFRDCEYRNCYATPDRTLVPIEEYAALLFYSPTVKPTHDLPGKRSSAQRYVYANFETPTHFYGPRTQYVLDNFYNWTMTYRFDSDIAKRHGYVARDKNPLLRYPTVEDVKRKTGTVAWFVSNCRKTTNNRLQLGKELQKYVDVDIYGRCGNMTCPRSEDCYNMVEKKYKFYLAFENSYCKDYSTEKLYKILRKNVVPIVYGGADYSSLGVAPPHSVINVEDFSSVQELGEYIKELAQDIPRYMKYFEWKKEYMIKIGSWFAMCDLCNKLNDQNEPHKVYKNISAWWFGDDRAMCKKGDDLPEIIRNLPKDRSYAQFS